ncbi:archaellin/type IV pilin N-terminal domain-containing protein [Salinirubellus sp. GCM10025818]|uniref:archaellin/type IV pilin N-terminal domain-containing protein n=1 Tax=Salinirubellus TaxID=2162630 RepID=UPI0036158BC8
MTSQQERWDSNRGLSPVIGTVFLVAIAVVLAAVVGSVGHLQEGLCSRRQVCSHS